VRSNYCWQENSEGRAGRLRKTSGSSKDGKGGGRKYALFKSKAEREKGN